MKKKWNTMGKIKPNSKTGKLTARFKKLKKKCGISFKTKSDAAAYLSGLIDGEGSVDVKDNRLYIGNTNKRIILGSIIALELIGIYTWRLCLDKRSLKNKNHTDFYKLRVTGKKEAKIILKTCPIKCSYKVKALEQIINKPNRKVGNQALTNKVIKLRKSGYTFVQIGTMLGFTAVAVNDWYLKHIRCQ